jgi:peptide/nickel transport system permease protein
VGGPLRWAARPPLTYSVTVFAYAVRRILGAIPTLVFITFVVYIAASSVTDPRDRLRGNVNIDQSAYDRIVELYELDKNPVERYVGWLGGVAQGDLGISLSQGERPVSDIFWERGRNTLIMALPAFLVLMLFGTLAGVFSALRQYSPGDYAVTTVAYLGLAMPTFFFGLLLQVVFAIWLPRWTGFKPFWSSGMHLDSLAQYFASVTLPVMTLLLVLLAGDSRFIRAAVLDIKSADYVRTARAKGLTEQKVVRRHIFRNALIPAVTVWSLDAAGLFGGSLITETVFSWPGFGRLIIDAIFAADLDVVMAVTVAIAVLVVVMNLLADLLYGVLDPRVRYD